MFIAAIGILIAINLAWKFRWESPAEPGFQYVYVNQDGTVRELSPAEQAYLLQEFSGGDSGRPYIKTSYESRDGWGSLSGFLKRRKVPAKISILPVHPDYDQREKALGYDWQDNHRAVGDLFQENPDGSVTIVPNPKLSTKERYELSRKHMLEDQRHRESMARPGPDSIETTQGGNP